MVFITVGQPMNLTGRRKGFGLLLHLLLFSIPSALVGSLAVLLLVWGWMNRQAGEAFPVALFTWSLLSVWSAYAALMLANTWRTAGVKGLKVKAAWLDALLIVSAFQAAAALAMAIAVIGWKPAELLRDPYLFIFGAPWASLSWHMRWLSRQEE